MSARASTGWSSPSAVMHAIHEVYLTRRVARGETVIRDVLGLGVDVIATSGILIPKQ